MSIMSMTAAELGSKIRKREISVEEAVKASLAQVKKMEVKVHSFVTVDEEGALKRAQKVQKLIDEGLISGPLAGVPAAVKDNLCTAVLRTTCISKILENFGPSYTA